MKNTFNNAEDTEINNVEMNLNEESQENNTIEIMDANDYELIEENNDEGILPGFEEVFYTISRLAIQMGLSFTFSFQIFLETVLLIYLSKSEDELASATLIPSIINTVAGIWMPLLFSISMIASNKIGELKQAEEKEENPEVLEKIREELSMLNRNGMFLGAGLSIPPMLTLIFSKPILTHVLGQKEEVAQIVQDVLRVYFPAMFPLIAVRMSTEQIGFSAGKNRDLMLLSQGSFILGTGIALGLGLGAKLGARGIVAGYVFEAYLTAFLYGLYLFAHKDFRQFQFFRFFKISPGQFQQFFDIIKKGSSFVVSFVSEMLSSLSLGIFSGLLGTKEQSTMAYVNQSMAFNFLWIASFGATNAQELNRLIGSKKYHHASAAGKYGLLTTLFWTTPLPALFAFSPRLLLLFGRNTEEAEAILNYLVPIISTGVIVNGAGYNLLQQLRVLGDSKMATLISVLGQILGIGAAGLLGLKTNLGIYGIGIGYSSGILGTTLLLLYRWCSRINAEEMKKNVEQQSSGQLIPSVNCFCSFFKCAKTEDIETKKLLSNTNEVKFGSI